LNRIILSLASFSVALLLLTPLYAGGWLGVTIEPTRGVQIGEIIKGGPADLAKLKNGDVILKVNGKPVQSIAHFIQEISRIGAKQKALLNIIRQGKSLVVKVTLDDSNKHMSVSQTPFFRMPNSAHHIQPFQQRGSMMPGVNPTFPGPSSSNSTLSDPMPFPPPPTPPSAWLGIAPGISNKGGIIVKGVAVNSPAKKAGIQTGDIIISINGQAVSSPASLVRLMAQFKPDDLVEVALTRKGKDQTLQVKMAEHPLPHQ
jgi:serine protease Do